MASDFVDPPTDFVEPLYQDRFPLSRRVLVQFKEQEQLMALLLGNVCHFLETFA